MTTAQLSSLHATMIPWFIRRSWAASRIAYARRKPAWEGTYASFDSIPYDGWFESDEWRDKSVHAVHAARTDPMALSQSKATLAAVAAPIISARASVRVLDFGGSAGADFAGLLGCLGNDASAFYCVVDAAPLGVAGREVWKGDERIEFRSDLPDDAKFDIVYSCSALQYIEDYRKILAIFASYRPQAMLFLRHCFTKSTFARKQINRGAMPEWAFGYEEFLSLMKSHGYRLGMRSLSEDDFNSDNYPPEKRIERSTNLLFVKEAEINQQQEADAR